MGFIDQKLYFLSNIYVYYLIKNGLYNDQVK